MELWERRLVKVYGLAEGDYTRMLVEQQGVCAICGKRPGRVRLAVDHDHKTGRIRGLIHTRCNRSLAPFESSEKTIHGLIIYLQAILADRTGVPPHDRT